jgi:uncharacterized repeat protein (TIGR03803 family)
MNKLNLAKRGCAVFVLCVAAAIVVPAQTLTTLHSFNWTTDGANPYAGLVQGTDGDLYGTTQQGVDTGYCTPGGCGTVFKITPDGTFTMLDVFNLWNGANPFPALIQAIDGNLYGTTYTGGAWQARFWSGTVFKIAPDGTLTTIFIFCHNRGCPEGAYPYGGLVQAIDGNLYGTTSAFGANTTGTVYKLTPSGTLTTFYNFTSRPDGRTPYAGLIQGTDGNFYGTTEWGGAYGDYGTVFKLTADGTLTTLHSFNNVDGDVPYAGLIQGADGNLFGTTVAGGAYGQGTVFKITPSGTLTVLHSFCSQSGCPDGSGPDGALVLGTDRNFYGTTSGGGVNGQGTVFEISPGGTLTTLHSFRRHRRQRSHQRAASGHQRRLLRDNVPGRRLRLRYGLQPFHRSWPVRKNTAELWQRREGHQDSGNQSHRRHQRDVQRHAGGF